MPTIYAFKNFNNYINRRVVGIDIDDIQTYVQKYGDYEYIQTGTFDNFNPGDGVQTTHTLGSAGNPKNHIPPNPYAGNCDYLLYCEDNNHISSRWFIIDHDFKCKGQYSLTLYRDTVVENWEKVKNADCFIEKATLKDDDPLIFNQEAITTNAIKKNELKLFDETKCQWIVGYMNKSHTNENVTNIVGNAIADFSGTNIAALETAIGAEAGEIYCKGTYREYTLPIYRAVYNVYNQLVRYDLIRFKYDTNNAYWYRVSLDWVYTAPTGVFITEKSEAEILSCLNSNVDAGILYYCYTFPEKFDTGKFNAVLSYNGKVGETTGDNKFYRVDVSQSAGMDLFGESTNNGGLNAALLEIRLSGTAKLEVCSVAYDSVSYSFSEIAYGEYRATLGNINARYHSNTSYDIFCIPYKDATIKNTLDAGWTDFTMTKELALSIAQGLAIALDDNLYDLQLLPYCPLNGIAVNDTLGTIDVKTPIAEKARYNIIQNSSNQPACILFWATSNTGTKYISVNQNWLKVGNKKINNQCDMIRIVSPNYNGQYELNAAKNGGINSFKVDYTYIPYRPYIHVAPIFNADGIYGDHNDDATGLVCGGDFSISYLSSAWEKYMTENKNYIDIFDRGTQNLDTNYKYQRIESIISAGVGALSAGVTGGVINPIVGVAGGIASAGGGVADLMIQQKLHNEAMDYRKDLFEMQLDNVKALPYSLAKVSTINENNKGVPFIEYYTCTDREKLAVAKKISWNGMTVGAIGKIADYMYNEWRYDYIDDEGYTAYLYDKGYIKAKLIRIEGVTDDTHILNALSDELFRGVYMK